MDRRGFAHLETLANIARWERPDEVRSAGEAEECKESKHGSAPHPFEIGRYEEGKKCRKAERKETVERVIKDILPKAKQYDKGGSGKPKRSARTAPYTAIESPPVERTEHDEGRVKRGIEPGRLEGWIEESEKRPGEDWTPLVLPT